ncbi:YunG family protein [Bacillus thuringiensis]|uniref:Uncharacterized protein n=1 Tax=Bacillus thuringiensis subsp. finitimus TaxID=29337 RepID=A0A243GRS3_BACTF|nr:hypothetical protein [Bacillus thuringiensis]ALQ67532.1 hypothetical protein ATN06_09160 [Bacillus thuringiensis]OUA09726.1 hypothetical protein BK772_10885 [Bacillus thuringiensis serovar finitimus]
MDHIKRKRIYEALIKSWSIETNSKWTIENPAKGQCGVTALIIQELCGGEIRKTKIGEVWHFYNIVDEERYDFIWSQFSEKLNYMDIESNREEAFADTNEKQYSILKEKLMKEFKLSFDS